MAKIGQSSKLDHFSFLPYFIFTGHDLKENNQGWVKMYTNILTLKDPCSDIAPRQRRRRKKKKREREEESLPCNLGWNPFLAPLLCLTYFLLPPTLYHKNWMGKCFETEMHIKGIEVVSQHWYKNPYNLMFPLPTAWHVSAQL